MKVKKFYVALFSDLNLLVFIINMKMIQNAKKQFYF